MNQESLTKNQGEDNQNQAGNQGPRCTTGRTKGRPSGEPRSYIKSRVNFMRSLYDHCRYMTSMGKLRVSLGTMARATWMGHLVENRTLEGQTYRWNKSGRIKY